MRRILFAALTVALAAGITAGQGLPSVFLYDTSKGGTRADAASASLEGGILSDLFKKYPCIDIMDQKGVKAMLEFEKMLALLGSDPTQEQIAQIGGAIGARYVITVKAIQMENGMVYLSVSVIDTKTAKMVATRDSPPATQEQINSSIESLKNRILGDMANFLQGKCDEHWTGTITFEYKYDKTETKDSSADFAGSKMTSENSEKATDTIYVTLAPMSLGSSGGLRPRARISRIYDYHRMVKYETRMQVRCRPRGANSYLRPAVEKRTEQMDESGEMKATTPVYIYVYDDGRYQIRVEQYPELVTKWTREDNEQRPGGCEDPPPVIATSSGENSVWAGAYKHAGADIDGRVDPKNSDVLAGSMTLGNEAAGVQIVTWNLKRVRPKARTDR